MYDTKEEKIAELERRRPGLTFKQVGEEGDVYVITERGEKRTHCFNDIDDELDNMLEIVVDYSQGVVMSCAVHGETTITYPDFEELTRVSNDIIPCPIEGCVLPCTVKPA